MKTKIEWCDATLNPVMGCLRGCPYCYAKRMNDRYGWLEDFTKPQYFPERLKKLACKRPKSVFMNSMSDVEFWGQEIRAQVRAAMDANPQHSYIFLTKADWSAISIYAEIASVFYGLTICAQRDTEKINSTYDFLSIEPILSPIDITCIHKLVQNRIKTVIIGAETGNRRGKVIPRREWINDIVRQCDAHGIAVFMKNSLRGIMGDDFRTDKLPWAVKA